MVGNVHRPVLLRGSDTDKADTSCSHDEARITAFRELVYRLRHDAGLTQAELASRMGTTQSAIARMEGGGTRPTLETLEKLATAAGADLMEAGAPARRRVCWREPVPKRGFAPTQASRPRGSARAVVVFAGYARRPT